MGALDKFYESANWRELFNILLNGIGYELEVKAGKIIIKAKAEDQEKILNALAENLDSPEALQAVLPIRVPGIKPITKNANVALLKIPPMPEDSLETGLQILQRMYGTDHFKDIDFSLSGLFKVCIGHKLASDAFTKVITQQARVLQIRYLLSAFEKVELKTVRNAFLGEDGTKLELPDEEIEGMSPEVKGLIEKCLGLVRLPDGKGTRAFFDYLALWQGLFPPQQEVVKTAEDKIEIVLDLKHLGSYLEVLLKNGFLVTQKGQQAQLFAFGKKPEVAPPLICDLVIDRSGSMQDAFPQLQQDIIEFAERMWQENSTAEIHLTFFANAASKTKCYKKSDLPLLKADVNAATAGGNTRLLDTLLEVLDVRLQQQDQNKTQHMVDGKRVLIVFTDGEDNQYCLERGKYPYLLSDKCKAFGDNRPQIFAFAAGECNEKELRSIAENTAGEFLQGGTSDFPQVFARIAKMQEANRLMDFVVGMSNEAKTVTLALNDTLQYLLSLPIENGQIKFSLNEKTTYLEAREPHKLLTDSQRLSNFIQAVYALQKDQTTTPEDKKQHLEQICNAVQSLNLNESEQNLRAAFVRHLKIFLGESLSIAPIEDVPGLRLINAGVKIDPRGQKEVEDYKPGMKLGDFVYYKPKPAGIEPGFLGFWLNDEFYQAAQAIVNDASISVDELLEDPDRAQALLEQLDNEGNVLLRFQKQDYKDPADDSDQVGPDEHDMKRTNTVKAVAKVSTTAAEVVAHVSKRFAKKPIAERNLEAILETLSTAIAGLFMRVQQQDLLPSSYINGQLKYTTSAVWQKGFRDFTKQLVTGSGKQGLLAKLEGEELIKFSTELYRSEDGIANLGRILPIAVLFNDFDFIGSKGGNKGRVGNEFFGIDFGHAFREENKVVAGSQTDFSLPDLPSKCKNYSVFSDTKISEKNQGLLMLQKLRTGKMPTDEVLAEYPEEFQQTLRAIEPYADQKIFDAYLQYFLQTESYYIGIFNAKNYYLQAADAILQCYQDRINLSPKALEFIDSLEKLCSETTNIFVGDDDKKIQLNHLHKKTRVAFEPVTNSDAGFFVVKAENGKVAKELFDQYVQAKQINLDGVKAELQDDGAFWLLIPSDQMPAWHKQFSEKKIAIHKGQALPQQAEKPASAFFGGDRPIISDALILAWMLQQGDLGKFLNITVIDGGSDESALILLDPISLLHTDSDPNSPTSSPRPQ